MIKKCYGCGAILQDQDTNQGGYVKNLDGDNILCQRCYRMQHYNEYHSHYLDDEHFSKLIKTSINKRGLIILVVDLFDLSSSFDDKVIKLIKNHPIIMVGTKRDLLLKSVKDQKLKQYLKKQAIEKGLKVDDTLLVSAAKKQGIDELLASLEKHRHQQNVYMVGLTNVGKSSLVNALINAVEKSDFQITISNYPGTTLDTIQIELDDKTSLFDLPGLVLDNQMIHYINHDDYHYMALKKEVKARNYQLEPSQTLYIGGLAFFNFVSGTKTGFNCFFSNQLNIHRTKYEKHQELYNDHLDDDVLVPKANNIKQYEDFVLHEFKLANDNKKVDIYINGLGWITFIAQGQEISVGVPPRVKVGQRTALI